MPRARFGSAIKSAEEAAAIVAACEGNTGTITKVEKRESKDRSPLLYDLTSLQRDASSRFGFTASRTLGPPSGSTRSTRR